MLERVVLEQLQRHLDSELALNPLQSAYRRHHSTETALNKITSDILSEINCQRVTVLALLNFSAAFDTIEHQTLIDRLMLNYNISSVALNWFHSYLCNRQLAVCVEQSTATPVAMIRGIPQGSVLGSVLYTLYTAPLHHIISSHHLFAHYYADDTQIYFSCKLTELHTAIA